MLLIILLRSNQKQAQCSKRNVLNKFYYPPNIYLFKVNNRSTKKNSEKVVKHVQS